MVALCVHPIAVVVTVHTVIQTNTKKHTRVEWTRSHDPCVLSVTIIGQSHHCEAKSRLVSKEIPCSYGTRKFVTVVGTLRCTLPNVGGILDIHDVSGVGFTPVLM
jgi:hypothetical protein